MKSNEASTAVHCMVNSVRAFRRDNNRLVQVSKPTVFMSQRCSTSDGKQYHPQALEVVALGTGEVYVGLMFQSGHDTGIGNENSEKVTAAPAVRQLKRHRKVRKAPNLPSSANKEDAFWSKPSERKPLGMYSSAGREGRREGE